MEREKIGGEFGKFGGYSGDLEKIRKMIMLVENRGGEAVTIGSFWDHSISIEVYQPQAPHLTYT